MRSILPPRDGRLDLQGLGERAVPGGRIRAGIAPAAMGREPLGFEEHPPERDQDDDGVPDREPVTLHDPGRLEGADLATASGERLVPAQIQTRIPPAEIHRAAVSRLGVLPGQSDQLVEEHRVGHPVLPCGIPPGPPGLVLTAVLEVMVDDPELRPDIVEHVSRLRVGQDEFAHLLWGDQHVGGVARTGRQQGEFRSFAGG